MKLFRLYLRDKKKFPGVCVVGLIESWNDDDPDAVPAVHFGWSAFNPVDTYNRDIAVLNAYKRLETEPVCIFLKDRDDRIFNAEYHVANFLVTQRHAGYPRQVSDNARLFIKDERHVPKAKSSPATQTTTGETNL